MKRLSHPYATCMEISNLTSDDVRDVGPGPSGTLWGEIASAGGCDKHVYCDYCDGKCHKGLHKWAKKMWGHAEWNRLHNSGGSGPMAMMVIDDIKRLCRLEYPKIFQAGFDEEEEIDVLPSIPVGSALALFGVIGVAVMVIHRRQWRTETEPYESI